MDRALVVCSIVSEYPLWSCQPASIWCFPVKHASFIQLRRSIGVLIAVVLLCGCEQGIAPPESSREQRSAPSENKPAQASAQADSAFIEEREKAARIARLAADLAEARAIQTDLRRQRATIYARLVAHEEQSMALLEEMESETKARARQGLDDAAFKADVLEKLEAALAENDAWTTSLREIDGRLAEANAVVDRLTAEHRTLQDGV